MKFNKYNKKIGKNNFIFTTKKIFKRKTSKKSKTWSKNKEQRIQLKNV